jgi:caffeoyl-CoA O-methyltransferase
MSPNPVWKKIDEYIEARLGANEDETLKETQRSSEEAGLPPHSVSFLHGRLLQILAQSISAKRILEVGTLGGYSSTFFGRALLANTSDTSSLKLLSCEKNPTHAAVAKKNIERAGLGEFAEVRVGAGLDTLDELIAQNAPPFDLFFIDADKVNNINYFNRAIKLARPGSLIVVDNVIMRGAPFDDEKLEEPYFKGIREFNDFVTKDDRVVTTILQTVGRRNHDGLCISFVK